MKTLATITIAITLSLGMINKTFAGSMQKLKLRISAGNYIEVLSKVEETVTEDLPLQNNAVRQYYTEQAQLQCVPTRQEQPAEEEITLMPVSSLMISDYQLAEIVSQLSLPEQVVEESLPFEPTAAK